MASAGDALRSHASGIAGGLQRDPIGQTGIIFATMTIGFLVYITCKQQLGQYIALFVGPAQSNTQTTGLPATQVQQPSSIISPTTSTMFLGPQY